jgi:predicted GIY-YIG superfamily endonuclease
MDLKTTNVYVLQLKEGRFYIGRSQNVIQRYQEHLDGEERASAFTKAYPVEKLLETYENVSVFMEHAIVLEYMSRFNPLNVRGGKYNTLLLSKHDQEEIQRELAMGQNLCFKCNSKEHLIKDCPEKAKEVEEKKKAYEEKKRAMEEKKKRQMERKKKEKEQLFSSKVRCFLCKQVGHFISKCPLKFSKSFVLGAPRPITHRQTIKQVTCYKCGRIGHLASACFAKTKLQQKDQT